MLVDLLKKGSLTVAIYGLGYVGLALSAAWTQAGARVIGVDIDVVKVEKLNSGMVEYLEGDVVNSLTSAIREKRFFATTDGVAASMKSHVKIIAVPVLLKKQSSFVDVDFTALLSAVRSVGAGLKRGDLVLLESSVPPGTTEEVARPALENTSGLIAEEDFYLAYSPERIMTGHALRDIVENYPKIVAGVGPKSAEEAAELYKIIAKRGVIVLPTPKEAEFEKLLEGVYRDVNIALANEMAKLANVMGISFRRAREAANSQPYSHVHKPGTGVGGSCIPVYPYLLMWTAARYEIELPLTFTARKINEKQPEEVAFAVFRAMLRHGINPATAKIAVLGLAFRGDIDDPRNSPTYDLVSTLLKLGIKPRQIVVHDPYIERDQTLQNMEIGLTGDLADALREADVAIVATDHSTYRIQASRLASMMKTKVIIDARGVVTPDIEIYSIDSGLWP
ncbi:MAG: nucleotide sugar dehydrogenase [Pyrobaculum sp.]